MLNILLIEIVKSTSCLVYNTWLLCSSRNVSAVLTNSEATKAESRGELIVVIGISGANKDDGK